jgi:hypothetical protein
MSDEHCRIVKAFSTMTPAYLRQDSRTVRYRELSEQLKRKPVEPERSEPAMKKAEQICRPEFRGLGSLPRLTFSAGTRPPNLIASALAIKLQLVEPVRTFGKPLDANEQRWLDEFGFGLVEARENV